MIRENFFGGEAFENVSPILSDDQQAASFASFGQFGYNTYGGPMTNINPGFNGYMNPPMQPGYIYSPMQPGLGMQPQFNMYPPQQPIGYMPPPTLPNQFQQQNTGPRSPISSINPAFDYMYQNQNYFANNPYMQARDVTYDIPAMSIGGSEYLPPMGYEEELENMQYEYWREVQDEYGKRAAHRYGRKPNNYGGANQYGYNYYNSYYCSSYINNDTSNIDRKYRDRLNRIQDEARERRINLNIHLSKLAFNYLGMDYDEKALEEAYRGKTVTVPGITTLDLYKQQRFNNLVPFDNSNYYREKDAEVTREFRKFVKPDATMEEFFEQIGLYEANEALKAEEHRRRSYLKDFYDTNTFNTIVRAKAMELEAKNNGIIINENERWTKIQEDILEIKQELLNLDNFPTLKQHAHIADDGTLHISFNYQAPVNEVESNKNEEKYQRERERFGSFLQSIKKVASVTEDVNM